MPGQTPRAGAPRGPVVEVTGLVKDYGATRALAGVDLAIAHQEVFALLGPNGAGKTTLVEILEGHRRRTSGRCAVLGMDPGSAGPELRDRLGIVPQSAGFEIQLTVHETLAQYAGYYARPRPVDEIIGIVGLGAKRKERVGRLSGGQMRRLDLGLALVGDPELIFLDEPTTGFDPEARNRTWELINELRGLGKTILLTTHNLDEAQRLADRVAVLVAGQIVASGLPRSLLGPRTPRAVLRLPASVADPRLLPPELHPWLEVDGEEIVVRSPDVAATLHTLATWAVGSGTSLDALTVSPPSLEDMYLQILRDHDGNPLEEASHV